MRRLSLAVLCLGTVVLAGCRIEDHTPTGTRRDEDAVQTLIARYARSLSERNWGDVRILFWRDGSYSGPLVPRSVGRPVPMESALESLAQRVGGTAPEAFDVRVLRTDFRQDGDLAAAWVVLRRRIPVGSEGGSAQRDWVEHLVLRRIGGSWRILSVAGRASPRGPERHAR